MKKKIRTEMQRFSHLLIITANLLHLAAYSILRGFFWRKTAFTKSNTSPNVKYIYVDKYSHWKWRSINQSTLNCWKILLRHTSYTANIIRLYYTMTYVQNKTNCNLCKECVIDTDRINVKLDENSYSIVTCNNSGACCRGGRGLGGCCRWRLRRRSRTRLRITRFTLWTFSDTVSPKSFLGRVVTRSRSCWCSRAAWFCTITPYCPRRQTTVSILQSERKGICFNLSICLNNFFHTLFSFVLNESLINMKC